MPFINAIPTVTGLSILSGELKDKVTKFCLVGSAEIENIELENMLNSSSCSYVDIENHIFYNEEISRSFYDSSGVLSFEAYIPHALDFQDYLYAICLLTDDNQVVVVSSLGSRFQPIAGFGMPIVIATPISGVAGEIVFKDGNHVLDSEFEEFKNGLDDKYKLTNIYIDSATTINYNASQNELLIVDATNAVVNITLPSLEEGAVVGIVDNTLNGFDTNSPVFTTQENESIVAMQDGVIKEDSGMFIRSNNGLPLFLKAFKNVDNNLKWRVY